MRRISDLKTKYDESKNAKVGDTCQCPTCGTKFVKSNVQQAFCRSRSGTQCKDYYWNNVIPSKRNNTTRISPANARYYREVIEPNQNFDDDQGWDAHKDSF